MTGRVLGERYLIEDRIGIGGMAEVYRAQDRVLSRLVAVKIMLPQFAADADFTRRFRQEAAAAANLSSPYIVNVYDWGEDKNTYYIVMEYVRGSDLKTAISQRGAINQRKVAEIGSQVCQALSAAHNQDIIHRDIKPQNIMIRPDGNVKVMDFGIAHAKNSLNDQTVSVLGTAHYISPEQAQGKELTAASDIYSLGVVLYEAATGKLPFDGPDAVSVAMMQVNDQPVPPREINPSISPDLEAIIMCAMAKNPQNRFATANDMRAALNDFLAGRPLKPFNVNNGNAETQLLNSVGAGAAAGAGATVAYGNAAETRVMTGVSPQQAAGSMVDATQTLPSNLGRSGGIGSSPANFRAEPPKKSNGKLIVGIIIAIVAALAVIGGVAWAFLGGGGGNGEPVPNVIGLTLDEATAELQTQGFDVGSITEGYDEEAEPGTIIKQDPAAEAKRELGTKVNLTVSQGAEMVKVPDLSNMTAEQAKSALDKAGLVASAGDPEYNKDVEKGHVFKQDPAKDTEVKKGSVVTYVLSLGPDIIAIPSVVGSDQQSATRTLEDAGFVVNVQSSGYSSSAAKGTVTSQDPSANSRLEQGGTVTIYVSEGPQPEPPDVEGMYEQEAIDALTDAGFKYDVERGPSDTVDAGRVFGYELQANGVVTILVSTGPGSQGTGENENPSLQ